MSESPSLIMIQFLAWVADRSRTYAQTMDAWHSFTYCGFKSEITSTSRSLRVDNDA